MSDDIRNLPVFGPTEVQGDEGVQPEVIVRVAYALSREQLVTALGLGFAQIAPDRDPAGLAIDEIRAEVEGFLAAAGIIETDQVLERDRHRVFPPQQQAVMELLAAAVDRAYPASPAARPAVPGPRYGDGTVTLTTLDHGEVTASEPAWCIGHSWQPNPHRADITHKSVQVKGSVHTDERGVTEFMQARISHAPFLELRPEPHPVVSVELDAALDLEPGDTRRLAESLRSAAFRLESVAAEAERMREAQS